MEIVPVDETYLIFARIELLAEIEPRESASDYYDLFHNLRDAR